MSDARAVAWIGLIPKVFWPAIALLMAVLFRDPIGRAIDGAADGGATVTFGIVKIEFPKSEIPTPPAAIRQVLTELRPEMIRYIVANVGGNNTNDFCNRDSLDEFESGSVSSRLDRLKMIRFVRQDWHDAQGPCPGIGSKTTFTPLYDSVRNYLLSILESVRFKPS